MEEIAKELRDLKNEIEELKRYIMILVNKKNPFAPDYYPEPPMFPKKPYYFGDIGNEDLSRKPIRNVSEPVLLNNNENQENPDYNDFYNYDKQTEKKKKEESIFGKF
jgi:hypothetical protein